MKKILLISFDLAISLTVNMQLINRAGPLRFLPLQLEKNSIFIIFYQSFLQIAVVLAVSSLQLNLSCIEDDMSLYEPLRRPKKTLNNFIFGFINEN